MFRTPTHACQIGIVAGVVSLIGLSGTATAGGFALIEHGASGLGNAYAGAAAVSTDTSTVWFNPAGMSQIEGRETSVTMHILTTDTTWTDQGTTLGAALGRSPASGPDTANPGGTTVLPNFYYVAPINDQWSYGLSIGAPYGSATEYDRDWKGRYSTVKSGVSVIDINPAVSFKLSDKVSLGFGLSLQRLSAELESAVDSGAACLGLAASAGTSFTTADCVNVGLTPGVQANDGYGSITGDSTTFGFNMGALFTPKKGVKIGVAYRHSTSHELDGDADFDVNAGLQTILDSNTIAAGQPLTQGIFNDVPATAAIELPASFSVSGAWEVNNKVELLADLTWTGWSTFEEIRIDYDNPVQSDTLSVQAWEDVIRLSAGLNYQLNDKLTLRTGMAFDEEAIPSAQRRTARIPGNDRTWLSFGAGYKVNKSISFDVGYAHLFLDETPIDNIDPESNGTGQEIRGEFEPSVDIFSAQLNWAFN
ncbi:MAG: long-chain fatty acid transport protein [Granulosicoccus sp.]|jgi:long-chain fatty acid transport protein